MAAAAILAILVLAGAVQGAAGFGFGLVAVGLLSTLTTVKEASVLIVFATLSLNLFIFWRLRASFRFDRLVPLIAGAAAGIPLGIMLLVRVDPAALQQILGVVLLLGVVQGFIPMLAGKRWHPVYLGVPCGLFSGALAGAFGTGGPPLVLYVSSQDFDRLRYSATLQFLFAVNGVMRSCWLAVSGLLTQRVLCLSVTAVCCAVIGAWLGLHMLKRMPERVLRRYVRALLLVLAIRCLCW